jgi:hypothetical protein
MVQVAAATAALKTTATTIKVSNIIMIINNSDRSNIS